MYKNGTPNIKLDVPFFDLKNKKCHSEHSPCLVEHSPCRVERSETSLRFSRR